MKKTAIAILATLVFPLAAFAQVGNLGPVTQLLLSIGNLVTLAIPILIGVALLYFFWGLVGYIRHPGAKPGEHGNGKEQMIAGLVAVFVMVSVWGIIRFAQVALLGGEPNQNIQAPRIPLQ